DVERVEVHFMIRAALEGLAVRLATEHVDNEALVHLEKMHHQLQALAAANDLVAWDEANIAFYRFLFGCCQAPDLIAMIDLQRDRSPRFRHFPKVLVQRARESDEPREALLSAMRRRAAQTAWPQHDGRVVQLGTLR